MKEGEVKASFIFDETKKLKRMGGKAWLCGGGRVSPPLGREEVKSGDFSCIKNVFMFF